MFRIVIINLGFILIFGVLLLLFSPGQSEELASVLTGLDIISFAILGISVLICSVYLSAVSYTIKSVSDYKTFKILDIFKNIKHSWKAGLAMWLFMILLLLILLVTIPTYFGMDSVMGLVFAAIVIWVTVFGLISFQYYFSVYARLGGKIIKSFKKCMLIALDNTGFSVFLFFHNLIVVILILFSVFMEGFNFLMFLILFPGPAGILLYIDEALRLRLLKYDWLEANPDPNPGKKRRKVPWEALLIEEREKVGTRSFKNFIFPWKD